MLLGDAARTLNRMLSWLPGLGLGMIFQFEPFQCSISVCCTLLERSNEPTAQALHADSTAMLCSSLLLCTLALGGWAPVQAWHPAVAAWATPGPAPPSSPASSSGAASTPATRRAALGVRMGDLSLQQQCSAKAWLPCVLVPSTRPTAQALL